MLSNLKRHLSDSRLVTVTGIGGVGKSRTALRLAHQVRMQYPDGVWFADLARLQDSGMVEHTISSALGIADQSARSGSDTLTEWVGDRNMLLIIDTCEHLIEACADLVVRLLGQSPNLRILATSRQSMQAPGEHVVPIPPLTVPGDDPNESLFTNEAVQLFAARAAAVVPDFTLDEHNIGAVAELVRRLDGIPLAIELAAVRLRALSVQQILALLTDRFSLLAGASRTALPRHQTLRAAIGWSHEICEPAERLLWARLSVFAGDFELDAARAVCSDEDNLPAEDIMELVTGLVEKSVLLMHNQNAGVRYKLIDTLREYGTEWLDKLGQTETMRMRHRDYYLQLAETGEHAWSGPRQVHWFIRMRQEHDNVRSALEYCLSDPAQKKVALRLLSSLWYMWVACGFAREGRLYLRRALDANPEPSRERCKALWVLSYLCSAQGDIEAAQKAAEECSTQAVVVGDSGAVILATKMQGTAAVLQGDLQKATALLGVAIEFNRSGPELNPGLLPAILELAYGLIAQNEPYEAEALLRDLLQTCDQRGELWLRSYAHWATSLAQRATGRVTEALASVREALRIKGHFHDVLGAMMCLEAMARIAAESGDAVRAANLLGAAETNWPLFGLPLLGSPFLSDEHEQSVKECKRLIGESGYEEQFRLGARMDLEEAIAYALDDDDLGVSPSPHA
ncbi:putative ATPase [Thermocatellispora tengchongensis]|uniref:Putative ATPase n=1 Tax=Thermocatellispora tengchongensis TaxID=1073253 RepID=A0A840PBL2_9ACTN|nr:ATPase [Thermocatellispora tengchongensis]MBB5135313.1 putative ATPase [Thermocatellispora tengchongensis]